jgi:hypothetical protein
MSNRGGRFGRRCPPATRTDPRRTRPCRSLYRTVLLVVPVPDSQQAEAPAGSITVCSNLGRAGPRRIDAREGTGARAQRRYRLSRPDWTGPCGSRACRAASRGGRFDGQRACTCVNCHHARARWARRSAGRCAHGLRRAGRVGLVLLRSCGLADLGDRGHTS